MNIEQLSLFKEKVLYGSLKICKGKVTPRQIYELANKALEEALTIHSVVVPKGTFFCGENELRSKKKCSKQCDTCFHIKNK
jgi:hypothetical protein